MEPFFSSMDPDTAFDLARLSKEMFTLREQRKSLLAQTDCTDADALRAAITQGRLPEHPAFDAWLSIVLLARQERRLHNQIDHRCRTDGQTLVPANDLAQLADRLDIPPSLTHATLIHPDGIALKDDNGLEVLMRIASPQAWALQWRHGNDLWLLDNAPVSHAGLAPGPHLHRPDGTVVADPLGLNDLDITVLAQRFLDALAHTHVW